MGPMRSGASWCAGLRCQRVTDDNRRTVSGFVSNVGIGLMAIGVVLPLLRPSQLIVWAIAIALAALGAACMGISHWILSHHDD